MPAGVGRCISRRGRIRRFEYRFEVERDAVPGCGVANFGGGGFIGWICGAGGGPQWRRAWAGCDEWAGDGASGRSGGGGGAGGAGAAARGAAASEPVGAGGGARGAQTPVDGTGPAGTGVSAEVLVKGTGQGSVISPLLANVYLHYVFDLWAERWRRREAAGDMIMVRDADDIVVGFQHEADARRFWDAMRERLREFSLSLHPDKTRLIEFGRFAAQNREKRGRGKPETFKFLGFVLISAKSRRGDFESGGSPDEIG